MEFLKKHYEKLILSVVLLGLAVVAATLPMKVNTEKQKEEDRKNSLIGAKVTPYPPVDLSTNKQVLDKVKTPIKFDIAGKHNLFNPVPWVGKPNGEVAKSQGGNVGINALEVTAINPLQLVVTLDEVIPTMAPGGGTEYKYQVTRVQEGLTSGAKQSRAMSLGLSAAGIGTLKAVQGPPDSPTNLVLVLADRERTEINVSKSKPFSKVVGYAADVVCEFPQVTKKGVKLGETLPLPPEAYKIKVLDKDSVTFQDVRTQKQYTKKVASSK